MIALGLALAGTAAATVTAAPRRGSDESRSAAQAVDTSQTRKRAEVRQRARPSKVVPRKKQEVRPAAPSRSKQIVGGVVAPQGAYPFFTSIQTQSGFAFCGGTLVSSRWVLTAAHCVDTSTPASLRLVIGSNRLSQPTQGEVRGVTQILVNPSWNPATFNNDVALLRLDSASTKQWARLARAGDPTAAGQMVRAIGHGDTAEGGNPSDQLMQVDLPIQSDATMSNPLVYGGRFIGASMIGAGPLSGGQDTCQGDSGGPLFIAGASQTPLVGDTSWGDGCARALRPGVYGEVWQGAMRTFVDANVTRPANDDFAGQTISGDTGTVFGSNTDATTQPGEAVGSGVADTSVWYSWTAPASGPTTLNLRDAAFDTTLGVFTGSSVSSLTLIAGNDDSNGTLQSKLRFNAVAGTTYRIVVDGFAAAHGSFGLQWALNPPANDDFATPTVISGATGSTAGTNVRSTGEPGEPSHGGSTPDRTVWYQWTAPESGSAVLNTRQSSFDTTLAVYTGSAINALTQRASNDDSNSLQSKVVVPVTAGTVYRIAVDGFGAATGSIRLQWSVNRPANDDFAAPRVLPGLDGILASTSVRATGEPGELDFHGGAAADGSVWYRWTPTASGPARLRLGSVSAGFSPGMAVYTGSNVAALTKVAEGPTAVSLNVVAGTPYSIAVDGNGGSTGTFTLEWLLARCNGLNATIVGQGAINGTPGNDVIVGSAANDSINAGAGNDVICALGGNDTINGNLGIDNERGGTGNDLFAQGAVANGADRLDGEAGTDGAAYPRAAGQSISLNNVANDGLAGEADNVLTTVENVTGGSSNDAIAGSVAANNLSGGNGNDVLTGGDGNDTLTGGAGSDRMFGNNHNDRLNMIDGVAANDRGDGGAGTDTATLDGGDVVVNVP